MKLPEHIYKYQKIDQNTLIGLKNSQVYFARPSQFNDPYDCNHIIKPNLEEIEIKNFKKELLQIISDPEKRSEISKKSDDEISQFIQNYGPQLISDSQKDVNKKHGILCLTEKHKNLLMWGHYADSFKGICLEFSTQFEQFNKIIPVIYQENLTHFSFSKILNNIIQPDQMNTSELIKLYSIKYTDWDYEKEWRCLHINGEQLFVHEQQALTGVYFGPNIDETLKEIICLIIQGNNNHTKFYIGKLSADKFEITFEEKSYTSFIKTKCQ
jgi:hypothetical protein